MPSPRCSVTGVAKQFNSSRRRLAARPDPGVGASSIMSSELNTKGPGLVVLYRWRLHPNMESSFIAAWSRVSDLLRAERGSLGSRLHRGSDGLWYSYAQWPARKRERTRLPWAPLIPMPASRWSKPSPSGIRRLLWNSSRTSCFHLRAMTPEGSCKRTRVLRAAKSKCWTTRRKKVLPCVH